jgi:hypothetical protein
MKDTDKTPEDKQPKKRGGGPKTPEGKRRSSRNSTRHGLTAKLILMEDEYYKDFQELINDYIDDFRPASKIALDLIHELAACQFRLRRLWAIEATNLGITMNDSRTYIDGRYKEEVSGHLRAAHAFARMANNSNTLELLNRYEARFTRRMHQILTELKGMGCVPPAATPGSKDQQIPSPSRTAPPQPKKRGPNCETNSTAPAARHASFDKIGSALSTIERNDTAYRCGPGDSCGAEDSKLVKDVSQRRQSGG